MLNVNFEAMDLRTEIENIVHEILMEGVTKEDAVKELLNLHSVSQQRELFVKEQGKWLMTNTNLNVEHIIDFEMEFINK